MDVLGKPLDHAPAAVNGTARRSRKMPAKVSGLQLCRPNQPASPPDRILNNGHIARSLLRQADRLASIVRRQPDSRLPRFPKRNPARVERRVFYSPAAAILEAFQLERLRFEESSHQRRLFFFRPVGQDRGDIGGHPARVAGIVARQVADLLVAAKLPNRLSAGRPNVDHPDDQIRSVGNVGFAPRKKVPAGSLDERIHLDRPLSHIF